MKTIIILFVCILVTGCGPVFYIPNTQNVPVMKSKDQFNLSLGLNTSESADGFEIQSAFGLTDKIALQFNGVWNNYDDEYVKASGNLIEFGAGYYKNLGTDFIFETYGLIGFGGMKYKEENVYDSFYNSNSNYGNISASILRVGLQPSISYASKYFTASLSSRIASLNYSNISGNYQSSDEEFYFGTDYLKANNSHWLFEPAFTIQGGFENLKIQLQYVYSYNLTNSDFSQDHELLSIALKLDVNTKKKATPVNETEIKSGQN